MACVLLNKQKKRACNNIYYSQRMVTVGTTLKTIIHQHNDVDLCFVKIVLRNGLATIFFFQACYKLYHCMVYQSAIPLEKVRRTNLQMVHLGENYGCFVSTYVSTYLPVEKIPQKTHKHCLIFPLFLPQLLNKIRPTVIFIYHTLRFT